MAICSEEERLSQIPPSFWKVAATSRVNLPSGSDDASRVALLPPKKDRGSLRTDPP